MREEAKGLFSTPRHRFFRAAAVAAVAATALAGCSTAGPGTDADADGPQGDIVIGALLGLTGIAPIIGEAARVATQLAVDEINADGGIDGRNIDLVIADTESDPTTASLEFERLLNNAGAQMIIGPMFSQESFAVLPEISNAQLFNIHMTATSEITPDFAPYSFGALMNAEAQANKMSDYALETYDPKSVAILHDPGAQAIAGAEVIEARMKAAGVSKITSVEHAYGATDMTPFVLQATRDNPDLILLYTSTGGDLGNILMARSSLKLMDIPIVGANVIASQATAALDVVGGDESLFEGTVGTTGVAFATCEDVASGSAIDFNNAVAEEIGKDNAAKLGLAYASLYYDAVYIMKAAVEGSGGATDGDTLVKWMYDNLGSFEGVYSGLSVSPENHFMVNADAIEMVTPFPMLEGGLQKKVNC